MNNKKNCWFCSWLVLYVMLVVFFLGGLGVVFVDCWGIQVGGGFLDCYGVDKVDIGVVWDLGWNWWEVGGWYFVFVVEGYVGYWYMGGNVYSSIGEFGVMLMFCFIKSSGQICLFIEVGGGVWFLMYLMILDNFLLLIVFQFVLMGGVGVQFG